MQNKIYIIIILMLLSNFISMTAQEPMGLYYMNTIPQSSFLNPALQPRANGYVFLPDISQNLKSDVAFKNLVQNKGDNWMLPIHKDYNFKKLHLATGKSLDMYETLDIELIGLGFRTKRNYFTFDTKIKNNVNFGIPYELLSVLDQGFPNGKTFDLSTLKVNAYSYLETSFGLSRTFGDRLTLGVRVKPLVGLGAATSQINKFDFYTSRDYWQYDIDAKVNVAGPVDIEIEEKEDGSYKFNIEFLEDEALDYATSFENLGIAFDFGVDYKITSRWSVSVALLDLGSLKWKYYTNNINFEGKYDFVGIEVEGIKDDFEDEFDVIIEELKKSYTPSQYNNNFYTRLSPELYIGTNFEVTPYFDLGVLSRSIFYKDNFRQDFNISANFQPYSFMSANVNYSLRPRGGNGLGTALMFLVGPLQIYTVVDYIPVRYNNVIIDNDDKDEFIMFPNMRNLSFNVGLNLVFGRHGYKDIPMLKGY